MSVGLTMGPRLALSALPQCSPHPGPHTRPSKRLQLTLEVGCRINREKCGTSVAGENSGGFSLGET